MRCLLCLSTRPSGLRRFRPAASDTPEGFHHVFLSSMLHLGDTGVDRALEEGIAFVARPDLALFPYWCDHDDLLTQEESLRVLRHDLPALAAAEVDEADDVVTLTWTQGGDVGALGVRLRGESMASDSRSSPLRKGKNDPLTCLSDRPGIGNSEAFPSCLQLLLGLESFEARVHPHPTETRL